MMTDKIPENFQRIAMAQILGICTDQDVTHYAQNKLHDKGFNADLVYSFIELEQAQIENTNEFEKNILRGIKTTLPPTDPIVATQQIYKSKLSASKPISSFEVSLVVDEEKNTMLGCKYILDGQSLDSWCEKNEANAQKYIDGFQSYIEADVLDQMGVSVINGKLVLNANDTNAKTLTCDELNERFKQNEVKLKNHLEKAMKDNNLLSSRGTVDVSIEKFGAEKAAKKEVTSTTVSKPQMD